NVRALQGRDRQADTVHRNRTLLNDVRRSGFGIVDFQLPGVTGPVKAPNPADAINVTLHDVAAEPGISAHRTLEMHNAASRQPSKAGSIESFPRHLGREAGSINRAGRETYSVDSDTRAQAQIIHDRAAPHANGAEIAAVAAFDDLTDLFDDSCEHRLLTRHRDLRPLRSSFGAGSPQIVRRYLL